MNELTFQATILRKQDDLPRYIIVKAAQVQGRRAAFPASVTLNGGPVFKRNIRPWGKGTDIFFFNLTAEQCLRSRVETGDRVNVWFVPD